MSLFYYAWSSRRSLTKRMMSISVWMNSTAMTRCSSSIGRIGRWRSSVPFAREKLNLLRLYNQATAYGQKPSDFFELETEIGCWALDEACLRVGRRVENNLNSGKDAFYGFNDQSSV